MANKEKAEERNMDLERIVAMFLHKSGYQKTLDTFRSEAQLKDNDIKGNSDLEDLLRRFMESCGCNLTSCNEKPPLLKKQEETNSGVTVDVKLDTGSPADKSEPPACHDGETIVRSKIKKRKDKLVSDSAGGSSLGITKANIENIEKEIDRENLQTETSEDLKGKKKKAKPTSTSEMMSQFVEKNSEDLKLLVPNKTSQLDEPIQKSKNKKKKPTSDFSAFDANQGSEAALEAMKDAENANNIGVSENASNGIVPGQKDKKKKKKKKLTNDIVERLDEGILMELREENSCRENQAELSNTCTKFETDHVPKAELINTKSKKSKRKQSAAEGESYSNEKHAAQASEKDTNCLILHQEKKRQSSDALCPSETDIKHTKKKRKTQGAQDEIETLNANLDAPSVLLTKQEGNDSAGEKALNLKKCNGIHAKNEIDAPSANSTESYGKLSAEPKSVKAFQRVKVDEVKFADERLQDNSYWAKDGADVGYGAKAQEVLGQVKGRDFRHEKTKKKRGSYRGGQIDFNSHSIKFNYSDEE